MIPHFQHVFNLKLAVSMLVQTAFFSSYFVFSIPSAKVIDWLGYQKAMVVGLLTMGTGAFLFVPAAKVPSFGLFLTALIVLAAELLSCRLRPIRMSRFWGQPGPLPVG